MLNGVSCNKDIAIICEKILTAISNENIVNNHEVYITSNIGIRLFPRDSEYTGTLLNNADIAMYWAKDSGLNSFQFYTTETSCAPTKPIAMETSLRTHYPIRRLNYSTSHRLT
ncbi:MAG: putative signal transduction protein with EAL and GGDEF domain [Lentisphaeria bacterium]